MIKLTGYKHSGRTVVGERKITFHDAISLALLSLENPNAGLTCQQLTTEIQGWFPVSRDAVGRSIANFCGKAETSDIATKPCGKAKSKEIKTFWFAPSRGKYRLTLSGLNHARALVKAIENRDKGSNVERVTVFIPAAPIAADKVFTPAPGIANAVPRASKTFPVRKGTPIPMKKSPVASKKTYKLSPPRRPTSGQKSQAVSIIEGIAALRKQASKEELKRIIDLLP